MKLPLLNLATPEETEEVLKCAVGSVGPIGVSDSVEVVADHAVKELLTVYAEQMKKVITIQM